jgi:hypothetical protein
MLVVITETQENSCFLFQFIPVEIENIFIYLYSFYLYANLAQMTANVKIK